MDKQPELTGLRAGEYDILVIRLIAEGSRIHGHKNELIRLSLMKDTTWKQLYKDALKGMIVKEVRHVR